MDQKTTGPKYLKILVIILAIVVVLGIGYFVYSFVFGGIGGKNLSSPTPTASAAVSSSPRASCTPTALTDEERALLEGGPTINNPTYHFNYKVISEWQAAISNNDEMANFAYFPWGDESLAGINLIVLAGNVKVGEFPVGSLVEESHRTVYIDCIAATYTVYQSTYNEHTEKQDYHIRTSFTKDGVPYLVVLNYPTQGASADGDVVDVYNAILKTIDFE